MTSKDVIAWQWNCRSFKTKRASLQAFITTLSHTPTVIALQETGPNVKMLNYKAYRHSDFPQLATLIHRNYSVEQRSLPFDIPHIFTTILPKRIGHRQLNVLNIYSSPRNTQHTFHDIFQSALQHAGHQPLLIMGDFNAPHIAWGYSRTTRKGRLLWEAIQQLHLTTHNDPDLATRIGNSVQRDTAPDITCSHRLGPATWHPLPHTLGSDHFITELHTTIHISSDEHPQHTHITDWDAFRLHSQHIAPPDPDKDTDLEQWVANLLHAKQQHEKLVDPKIPSAYVDSKMMHLWEAYSSLERRWRKHKHRRALRRRLELLRTEITRHAEYLRRANWHQLCDEMRGTLNMRRTWALLRHLLDPSKSKSSQSLRITQLLHKQDGTKQDIISRLKALYIPTSNSSEPPIARYAGAPNLTLDAEISREEIIQALRSLRRQTAPGADAITNKLLRHLDDTCIDHITTLFNYHWEHGTLPSSWKHANISLIPKPNKTLALEHLRPISLTSCLGKLLEHVINTRLTAYLEENQLLPPNMIGFRPSLSTQDAMLQIHADILAQPPKSDNAAILALDLHKAFDHVSHHAILDSVNHHNLGSRTHTYITNFLSNRTATLRLGSLHTTTFPMPSRGTPQGAVLSPLLFNLAMTPLARALEHTPNLRSVIYADDITLWVPSGSDAMIEETLNQGASIVHQHAQAAGLSCSVSKSELLILPPRRSRSTSLHGAADSIQVSLDGTIIPHVSQVRILGFIIQSTRSSTHTIAQLRTYTTQIIALIKRITTRKNGLVESERLRLLHSFLISRFCYHLPYATLTLTQKQSLDALLRRAYRAALLLPTHAPTERLLALGLHNTVTELLEAHRTAQITRLSQTPTGRCILERAHLDPPILLDPMATIPLSIRSSIHIKPLPRNMNPAFHIGRRLARARDHLRRYSPSPSVVYVDAAEYPSKPAFGIAVIGTPGADPQASATVLTSTSVTAEEAAIALALTQTPTPLIILSDSQPAIRNYLKGTISSLALQILRTRPPSEPVTLLWTPAHTGIGGNEAAHHQARALTHRAGASFTPTPGVPEMSHSVLLTYRDITQHYRLLRRQLPPPHPSLTAEAAHMWRLLQTHSFPHRTLLVHTHPHLFSSPNCPLCDAPDTLYHSLCECPRDPFPPLPSPTLWEQALGCSDRDLQELVTGRALDVAAALWATATPPP